MPCSIKNFIPNYWVNLTTFTKIDAKITKTNVKMSKKTTKIDIKMNKID